MRTRNRFKNFYKMSSTKQFHGQNLANMLSHSGQKNAALPPKPHGNYAALWSSTLDLTDWSNYMKSNDKKQKIIQKAKRTNFRQEISKATETPQGLWRLAKWAKDKSRLSREVSKMPMLKFNDQVADTFDQKAEMLKGVFFPAPPPADLSDIEGSFYPTSPHCLIIITKSEVSTALSRLKSDKAPGPDGISNRILKACSEKLVELLTPLFQACVTTRTTRGPSKWQTQ